MAKYEIFLKPSALNDMDALRRFDAVRIADAMERHLMHRPAAQSRSRIKRLRGKGRADYRLRVGQFRVLYTIDETASRVVVLRVMHKAETKAYLEELDR